MGLAPCTGSPGAAPLTPAMGCEGGGRSGRVICLCQEPARETVSPERGRDGAAWGAQRHATAPLACGTAGASTMCQLGHLNHKVWPLCPPMG